MDIKVKDLIKKFNFNVLRNECILILDERGNDLSCLEITSIFDLDYFLTKDKYLNYDVLDFQFSKSLGLEIYIYIH